MAFWPSNDSRKPKVKDSSKTSEKTTRQDYFKASPYLEPGLIGSATFSPDTLKWNFLSNALSDTKEFLERRLKYDQHAQIFPPTRVAGLKRPRISVKRQAEQGANFLRTYLPDVDITSELIREHLEEDIRISRESEKFDPHTGDIIVVYDSPSHDNEAFILFAGGQTSCDLNLCAMIHTVDAKVEFYPQTSPLYTFQTPIQQLTLWSIDYLSSTLAVRTVGSLHIMKLEEESNDTLAIEQCAVLSSSEVGREAPVDMKPLSTSMGLLTLGRQGGLFDCTFATGTKIITKLCEPSETIIKRQTTSEFWRLAKDKQWHSVFILSSRDLVHFDSRSRSAVEIFTLGEGKHIFTSIEDVQQDHIVQACSTDRLWWFDPRYPGKPMLAYAHGREFDQYLSNTTVRTFDNQSFTFLTSRNNSLVTLYDVSKSTLGLIQLNQSPYCLEPAKTFYEKDDGHLFITTQSGLASLRVSEQGALTYTSICASNEEAEDEVVVNRNQEVSTMEANALNLVENNDELGASEFAEVDMRDVYQVLFKEHFDEQQELEKQNKDSLDKLLQSFPYLLRNHELPLEHMLTTYDVAFRSGDEPEKTKRADFLTDSALNTLKAYDALIEGRFDPLSVAAPWHRSIAQTMQCLDPELQADPKEIMEYLQKSRLTRDYITPQAIVDFELKSAKQLTFDLRLSNHIFSETMFAESKEADPTLETMTEALTIADELPPVEFGYLRPMAKKKYYRDEEELGQEHVHVPLGARTLLKGWDNGDPDDYIYHDPYGVSTSKERIPASSKPTAAATQLREFVIQSQHPPTLASSTTIGQPQGRGPPALASTQVSKTSKPMIRPQPGGQMPWTQVESPPLLGTQDASSQETVVAMASTQIVPGPFGARPPLIKKKTAKKRVGGF
ncbi:hypothetical protein CPB83DRAFT_887987 [Crepidotus variabilis]|uniref:RRN6 K-rich C-terminal domain-containing protein n=1 Tax=Crepidotus variabilis TaxID=179855 RepID=A0A9P6ESE3_9AGAR|nr:hypothetical protein CPB83DRAFT_887987 [Crepidotus variabilis]